MSRRLTPEEVERILEREALSGVPLRPNSKLSTRWQLAIERVLLALGLMINKLKGRNP